MKEYAKKPLYETGWITPLGLGLLGQVFMGFNHLGWTLGPGLLLLAASVFSSGFYAVDKRPLEEKGKKFPREWAFLALALLVSLFFRCYLLDRIPAGIYLDIGSLAYGSERILKEGWRPFYEVYSLEVREQPLCYQLAAWFGIFGVSRFSLFGFSILTSMLALLLAFFSFRQLAGSRAALISVALMGTARWYLTFSRCAHPAFEVPFYICGTLGFWLLAARTGRWWAWAASMLFLATSTYSYQTLKIFPLAVFLWALFEGWGRPRGAERTGWWKKSAVFFTAYFVLTAPFWGYVAATGSLGQREDELWFMARLRNEGAGALFNHAWNFLLMFHRKADPWPVHNWSDHRVLDAATGLLFLFGFVWALRNWRQRTGFYALTGLAVFSLPCLLSVADAPLSRGVGLFPFALLLAGFAGSKLWEKAAARPPRGKWFRGAAGAALLAYAAASNFYAYFYKQSQQADICQVHWTDATVAGERLAKAPEDEIYLVSRFFRNYDVDFLAFDKRNDFKLLDPCALPGGKGPVGKSMLFVLDEGKTGLLHLLQDIFPQGTVGDYEYFKGWPLVYFYRVPAGSPERTGSPGGIRGVYRLSSDWSGPPAMTRTDPFLNFTFRNDFGLADFKTLSIRWTGSLHVPETGSYSFLSLTTDYSSTWIDGKKVSGGPGTLEGAVTLTKGMHPIRIDFQKSAGVDTAFSFLWKVPGDKGYRVIPFWQWDLRAGTGSRVESTGL